MGTDQFTGILRAIVPAVVAYFAGKGLLPGRYRQRYRRRRRYDSGRDLVVEDQHTGQDRKVRTGEMRHSLLSASVGIALAGCTVARQVAFQADIAAFNNDVALIDSSIATVSTALANNCTQLAAAGQALASLIGTSTAAGAGLAGVDAAIVSYCQAHPTNITTAVSATAAAVSAGKAAQTAARAGN